MHFMIIEYNTMYTIYMYYHINVPNFFVHTNNALLRHRNDVVINALVFRIYLHNLCYFSVMKFRGS